MKIPTIDDLKSRIGEGGGFANPSLYYVSLPTWNTSSTQKQQIEFLTKSISLPSRSFQSVDRIVGQDFLSVPYTYSNPSISMTFRVLNDHLTRQYIENWQQFIIRDYNPNVENNFSVGYPDDYLRDIRIFQLDKGIGFPLRNFQKTLRTGIINVNLEADVDLQSSGAVKYAWHLIDAYPSNFTQETLSDDAAGTVSEITVEFTYRKWKGYQLQGGKNLNIDVSTNVTTDISNKLVGKIYDFIGG